MKVNDLEESSQQSLFYLFFLSHLILVSMSFIMDRNLYFIFLIAFPNSFILVYQFEAKLFRFQLYSFYNLSFI